jgi:hypothetical protein
MSGSYAKWYGGPGSDERRPHQAAGGTREVAGVDDVLGLELLGGRELLALEVRDDGDAQALFLEEALVLGDVQAHGVDGGVVIDRDVRRLEAANDGQRSATTGVAAIGAARR